MSSSGTRETSEPAHPVQIERPTNILFVQNKSDRWEKLPMFHRNVQEFLLGDVMSLRVVLSFIIVHRLLRPITKFGPSKEV